MNKIEAQDLRIGNWVHYDGVDYRMACPAKEFPLLEDDGIYGVGTTSWEHCSGIPLSPEWLERLGFSCYNKEAGDWSVTLPDGETDIDALGGTSVRVYAEGGDSTYMKHIKYVHQLQNLYHALTNTELQWSGEK